MSIIPGSPSTLWSTGASLHAHADSLRSASTRIRQAGERAASVWRGSASLQYLARSAVVTSAMVQVAEDVDQLARATCAYAGQLERCQQDAAALARRREALAGELDVLLARRSTALEAPVILETDRRMAHVRGDLSLLDRRSDEVREELTGWQRRYAEVLQEAGSAVPPWLVLAKEIAEAAGQGLQGSKRLHQGLALARYLGAAVTAVDVAQRLARTRQAAQVMRKARKPPLWARLLGVGHVRAVAPLSLAWKTGTDVITGGGYDGWRGAVTRYFAAEATIGAVAIHARHPVALAVGAGLVGRWALWKGGNALWDNRQGIAALAGRTWRGAVAGAGNGRAERVGQLLTSPMERARAGARWLARQVKRATPYGPGQPMLPGRLRLPGLPGPLSWRIPPVVPPALPPVVPPALRPIAPPTVPPVVPPALRPVVPLAGPQLDREPR